MFALALIITLSSPAILVAFENPADVIMARALQKARDNERIKKERLLYEERYTVDEWDSEGNYKSHEEKRSTISNKNTRMAGMGINIYEALATRYDFKMAKPDEIITIDNNLYSVIEFVPKPGLKLQITEDNFINRLRGTIYVRMDDYSIWKTVCSIPDKFTFTVWYLFIPARITINKFELSFQQGEFQGVVVESSIKATTEYETAIKDGRREYLFNYSNFRFRD